MKLLTIKPSLIKGKRLTATFINGKQTIITHFGLDTGQTYLDHKDDSKRSAYIARHRPNEDWNDPTTAGSLSRYILWEKPTLYQAVRAFKMKFNL